MATDHNFRIKNGLEVGGQLIVDSNGQLVVSAAGANLEFPDSTKLFFGDQSDLSIYHSGSHSFIQETGTGSLYIDSSGLVIRNASNNASMIVANAGGAVSLYNNGNLKLETTANGIDVTGKIQINDADTIIEEGNSNSVRVQTNSGYIDIGPHNTSWAHIETDRARYYFNKGITVNTGLIGSYDEDLQIQRAGTTKLTVTTTGVDIAGDLTITGDLNTVNTTTLDVSDKLITAGVGGTAATNSGGGFKISGANAEFLWDNANTQMTLNKDLKFTDEEKLKFGNSWFKNSGDNNHVHFYSASGLIPHSTTTANNSPLGTSSFRWEAVYAGVGDYSSYVQIGTHSGVAFNGDSSIRIQRPGNAYINIKTPVGNAGGILIGDTDDNFMGGMIYNNNTDSLQISSSNGVALTLDDDRDASFHRNVTAGGYLQATSYLYTRDNLRVLNTAGDGWNTWATRSSGNYNLNVGSIQTSGITSSGNISITNGLFQADEGNQKLRQYEIASSAGTQSFFLGKIETSGSTDGGVTGVVKAAYDYGETVNNCNVHFAFAQRNGSARGHWWYENTDDDSGTDVISVKLIDDGSGGMHVWLHVGDYVHCLVEATWRQVSSGSISSSGTLSAGTITSGTTLFDTANDPTSEHHIGKLYAHNDIIGTKVEAPAGSDLTLKVSGGASDEVMVYRGNVLKYQTTSTGSYLAGTTLVDAIDQAMTIGVSDKVFHYGDTDTYLKFDTDRIRLYAGNSVKFDSNNTYLTTADEGSGNGIDADTVDGQHGADLARWGHTYYSNTLSRAVGSGVQWYKVASFNGGVRNISMRVNTSGDNTNGRDTFLISLGSYNMPANIIRLPSAKYNGTKLMEVRTKVQASPNTNLYEIWVKVQSISSSAGTLKVYMNDSNVTSTLSAGTEPTVSSHDATLVVSAQDRIDYSMQATRQISTEAGYAIGSTNFIDTNRNLKSIGNITATQLSTVTNRVIINNGTTGYADGLTIGTANGNCELDLYHSSGKRYRFNSNSSGDLRIENKTDTTNPLSILANGNIEVTGNTTVKGASDSTGKAFSVTDSTNQELMYILNTGELVMPHNYLYVNHSSGIYSTGAIKARGGITNDGSNELVISSGNSNINMSSKNLTNVATINTGHGANELYPMNQAVRTTDDVQFDGLTLGDAANLHQNGFNVSDSYYAWKRVYSVSNTSPQEILFRDGTSLDNGGMYRFTAHISGTGTDNNACATFWNQDGSWRINVVGQSGQGSNHPEFIIDATSGKPTIRFDHTSTYSVHIYHEWMRLNEELTGTDNKGYAFGTDGFLGSVGDVLRFRPNGTTNTGVDPYTAGHVIWHANNDGPSSGLNADLLDDQHGSYYLNYNNFSNTPTIPSLSGYATESYVDTAVSNLVDSAPGSLDTLNELAAALGDDANFSTTVTNSIAAKVPLSGGTMTGNLILEDSELRVGDTSGDKWTRIKHAEADGYGFDWQHDNATVIVNEQGSTNQVLVLGDVDAANYSGLFGVAHTTDSGSNWTKKLDLRGNGELYIGASGTSRVFHDGYHPNADTWTTSRTITLSGEATGSVTLDGSSNVTLSVTLNDNALNNQYVQILPRHNADGDSLVVTSRASITIWDVSGASDAPSSASDGLVLSAGWDSASWGIQQYHDFHSNDLYLRAKNNGSMTSWDRVFHDTYHPNADKWTSSRTLTLAGDLSGNVSFDGSANFTLTATVADDSHNHIISNVDGLQAALDAKQASGTYNTIIGTDTDINTSGATVVDQLNMTDGVIQSHSTRTMTLGDLGYTGATNANYITNNNQLTNGAGYTTFTANQSLNTSSSPTFNQITTTNNGNGTNIKIGDDAWFGDTNVANTIQITGVQDSTKGYIVFGSSDNTALGRSGTGNLTYGSDNVFHDGYHPNADKWTSSRTLTLAGDLSGSVSFDGSANFTLTAAVANDSHNHTKLFENGTITFGSSQLQWMDQDGTGGTGLDGAAPRNPANGWYHNIITNHGNSNGYYSQISLGINTNDMYFGRVGNGTAHTFQRVFMDNYHPNADKWTTARSHTVTLTGDVTGSASQNVDGTGNKTWTIDTAVSNDSHNHNHSDGDFTVNGGLIVEGSKDPAATDYGYYQSAGTNIILKGDASGRSGIFFESEKDGANINDPSDYGFIQFHAYGYGGTSGENIDMVIGTANDSADHVIIQSPYNGGVKVGYKDATSGTGLTTQTVFHDAYHPNADKWTTSRTLTLAGDLTGSVSFDGSSNFTLTAAVVNNSHTHDDRYVKKSGDTMTGDLSVPNKIIHADDTDTYMTFAGIDEWALFCGGTRMIKAVEASSNVDYISFFPGTGNAGEIYFDGNGNIHADANITAYSSTTGSDKRLKENIRPLENSLDKVLSLDGVMFDWKKTKRGKDQFGFIAQQVEEHVPELVGTMEDIDIGEAKTVNYEAVVPMLVEALKEQQDIINRLESRIKDLEDKG